MDKQLLKSFKILKDLTIYATFTKTKAPAFDFGSGQVSAPKEAPKVVPLIEVSNERSKKESTNTKKTVMARKVDLGDLNSYDTLQFDAATWKIGNIMKGVGLIYIFEVVKNG
jgi:hypothetical protein